jgi:O-antigen ligase
MIVGLLICAVLAAAAIALPRERARLLALLGAAVATPIVLVAHVSGSSAFDSLRDRPAVLAVGAVLGLAVVAVLGLLVARRPDALPLLAVAALPFRIPIAIGGTTANLLVPLYVVLGGGVVGYALVRLRGLREGAEETERAPGWLERLLALTLVLYAVQATYSDDVDRALENVVFFYVPFALLFVLLSRAVTWTQALAAKCLGVLTVLALLFVGIGFVEYATKTLLFNPKVITSNQFEDYFRVNSLFFDPNIYGRFLALTMLGIAGVLLWTTASRTAWAAAAVLAVLWAGLVLTFSQSSFTALLVGLAILAGLRWNPRLALGAVGALAVVGIAVVVLAPGAIHLQTSKSGGVDDATSGRYDLIAGGVRLAADRPLDGWGSGAFPRTYRRREEASAQKATSASHTIPVTVAAEQGLPGLLVYLALLGVAGVTLLRGARESLPRAVIVAAFGALLVHTMLYASFLEDPLSWALLGVGAALAAVPRSRLRPPG